MRVAELEQPVVQVLLVGLERRRPGPGTPDDREQEVEQRDGEHRDRQYERQQRREQALPARHGTWLELAGQRDRRRRQQEPDQQRAGVTHEDPGGIEVVRQEAEADPAEHDADQRGRGGDARSPGPPTAGRRTRSMNAAPIATTPAASPSRPSTMLTAFIVPTITTIVSSVPCAGESDERAAGQRDPVERHALDDHHAGGQHLAGQLRDRVEAPLVVDHADHADQRTAREQRLRVVGPVEHALDERELAGEEEADRRRRRAWRCRRAAGSASRARRGRVPRSSRRRGCRCVGPAQ